MWACAFRKSASHTHTCTSEHTHTRKHTLLSSRTTRPRERKCHLNASKMSLQHCKQNTSFSLWMHGHTCSITWSREPPLQGTGCELGHPHLSSLSEHILVCLFLAEVIIWGMGNRNTELNMLWRAGSVWFSGHFSALCQKPPPPSSSMPCNAAFNLRRTYSAPSWSKSASSGKWLIWEHTPLFTPGI